MIRVTFLGVGAALPAPGQTNCAYLIETGDVRLLFDCGPAILQQLAAVGRTPGDVTHLFVSHAHGDHALGWPMFRLWWGLHKFDGDAPRTLPTVVASEATWAHLRVLWDHSYGEIPAVELPAVELPTDRPHVHQLTPAITLSTRRMVHSDLFPVLGARLETEGKVLVFTADTARCDSVLELARGADLLVHDSAHAVTVAPRKETQSRYHCSARDAGEYASAAGAKRLALVHVSAEYEGRHEELAAEARTRFAGPVFAPRAGETATV
jgi:ribonuclease BN (tRNA processing enzyme)